MNSSADMEARRRSTWLPSLQLRSKPEAIHDPNCVKVVTDKEGYALYFSRAAIPHLREGASPPRYLEHIGIYAFRKRALLDFSRAPIRASEAAEKIEALRFLEHGVKIKVVETEC